MTSNSHYCKATSGGENRITGLPLTCGLLYGTLLENNSAIAMQVIMSRKTPVMGSTEFWANTLVLYYSPWGEGEARFHCLHRLPGIPINGPHATHNYVHQAVHGQILVIQDPGGRVNFLCGMGMIIKGVVRRRLESERGAVVLAVESQRPEPTAQGVSIPERIAGQHWPGQELY